MASLSEATLGLTFYALGLGLLGGFVGNILAGWFKDIDKKSRTEDYKKAWIRIFVVFGVILVILGMVLMTLF